MKRKDFGLLVRMLMIPVLMNFFSVGNLMAQAGARSNQVEVSGEVLANTAAQAYVSGSANPPVVRVSGSLATDNRSEYSYYTIIQSTANVAIKTSPGVVHQVYLSSCTTGGFFAIYDSTFVAVNIATITVNGQNSQNVIAGPYICTTTAQNYTVDVLSTLGISAVFTGGFAAPVAGSSNPVVNVYYR